MKYFLRPYSSIYISMGSIALLGSLAIVPCVAHAQAQEIAPMLQDSSPLAVHAATPGYLGVDVVDVDSDKAQALKLKDPHGAVITLIDHDAPAGQIGLHVNDVVVAINGQPVDTAETLRRMLREIPPGRNISLGIIREGNLQTIGVQLADRKVVEHDAWSKISVEGAGVASPTAVPGMGLMGGGGDVPSSGFHMSLFTGTLNVGAMVEPLTSQMAEYLGVAGGLMVKQVTKKSEAALAGLKAFDVIVKVGTESINTAADWDRSLRSNQGKPVQVTILRDKKQQTLTLQVDSKHRGANDRKQEQPAPSGSAAA